jgi:polysaccharide biosynthesis/export protein
MKLTSIALFMFALWPLRGADAPLAVRDQRYRIQPSDRLELNYRYTPEEDQTLVVQPDGFASLKLVGDVKIGGTTLDEARTRILDSLKARLNDPEITLTLVEYVRPMFTVVGQVASPGRYELHGSLNTIEAIAMAGGFKDNAKHSQVILFRRLDKEHNETRIVNFKELTNPAHPHIEESPIVQAGDLLIVPKNRASKVADYVHWINFGGAITPAP